jgi:hypothetical protein
VEAEKMEAETYEEFRACSLRRYRVSLQRIQSRMHRSP